MLSKKPLSIVINNIQKGKLLTLNMLDDMPKFFIVLKIYPDSVLVQEFSLEKLSFMEHSAPIKIEKRPLPVGFTLPIPYYPGKYLRESDIDLHIDIDELLVRKEINSFFME